MNFPAAEFIIDEVDLVRDFVRSIDYVEQKIELIDVCASFTNSTLFITDDWENLQINEEKLGNFIFSNEFAYDPNNRDVVLQWAYTINQLDKFSPEDFLAEIDLANDVPHFLAFVRHKDYKLAVVSFDKNIENSCEEIKLVSCETDAYSFRDHIFDSYIDSEEKFWECSTFLYPNLYFHRNGSSMKIDKMGFQITEILPLLINVVKYLDRNGQKEFSVSGQHFTAHAKAAGINLSQESSNTNNNREAKKQRDIFINGETVHCEWHAKILPHKGRVHFNEGSSLSNEIKKTTNGKLVVGILCEHLDT